MQTIAEAMAVYKEVVDYEGSVRRREVVIDPWYYFPLCYRLGFWLGVLLRELT